LLAPISNKKKRTKRKKKRSLGSFFVESWRWNPLAPKSKKKQKGKKKGAWALLLLNVGMEPTCTHKQQNIEKEKEKNGTCVM
jgi:hypothetical protein